MLINHAKCSTSVVTFTGKRFLLPCWYILSHVPIIATLSYRYLGFRLTYRLSGTNTAELYSRRPHSHQGMQNTTQNSDLPIYVDRHARHLLVKNLNMLHQLGARVSNTYSIIWKTSKTELRVLSLSPHEVRVTARNIFFSCLPKCLP